MANFSKSFNAGSNGLAFGENSGIFSEAFDPSVGAGQNAPTGSLLLHTGGTLYIKTAAPDTSWEQIQRAFVVDKGVTPLTITTTGPTNFINYIVPGGLLGTTNLLRICANGTWTTTTATNRFVTLTISYGGTILWQDSSPNLNNNDLAWNFDLVLSSAGSVTAQRLNGMIVLGSTGNPIVGTAGDLSTAGALATPVVNGSSSINSAVNQSLIFSVTFNAAGSNNWTKNSHIIEKL